MGPHHTEASTYEKLACYRKSEFASLEGPQNRCAFLLSSLESETCHSILRHRWFRVQGNLALGCDPLLSPLTYPPAHRVFSRPSGTVAHPVARPMLAAHHP